MIYYIYNLKTGSEKVTKTLGRALPYPSFEQTPKEQQFFSGNLPIVE